jgi:hypothetical protein
LCIYKKDIHKKRKKKRKEKEKEKKDMMMKRTMRNIAYIT